MRTLGVSVLVQVLQALYENSRSAILLNSQLGKFFKTKDVRQGGLRSHPVQLVPRPCRKHSITTTHPSPIMDSPYATYVSPTTSILWSAAMVNCKTSPTDSQTEQRHMEWKEHRKEQAHTNSTNNVSAYISMNDQKLEEVTSFKYLGATLC